ncbi:TonB-dependent receptor [uncultured Parabacteroides sp.]|uniref:SusC/RagA family TonB-linked outer membrane protein n=2 Tax=uncultured Parabacteroides sp. TaxID=512312 RepID=UPI0025D18D9F|nr:TonB-dependent receptor [uncultured Parabacteroides sp.]
MLISFVGMVSQQVKIQAGQMTITLTGDNRILDEVVVVGYGTTRREAKTGSITSVSSEELSELTASSFDKMLAGKMAGVQITSNSGQPGANSEIRIRGISSINAGNEPLYVIDGVAVMSGEQGTFTNTSNALAMINPNDIESITVLKDAAAASVYGSRAANGVILVTTKSGKEGKSRFTARAKYGVSSLANDNDYRAMNGQELWTFRRDALINAGYNPDDSEMGSYYYPQSMLQQPMTDWIDHFTRTGQMQEYEISATGGSNKTSYFSSASYHKNEGVFYGIKFERIQARVNVDHELNKYLKTGVRVNVGYSNSEDVAMQSLYYSNPIFAGMTIQPWTKPYNEDGSHTLNIPENSNTNPRATAEYDKQYAKKYSFNGNMYLQWTPIKGLVVKTTNSAEMSFVQGMRYWSPETNYGAATTQTDNNQYRLLTTSNTATYENTFLGNHSYRVLVGQEALHRSWYQDYIYAANVDGGIPHPQTSASPKAEHWEEASTMMSFFGILDYNYASRYYLQASVRWDGSSRFGKENIWGTFYSVGASWNIHNEHFMEDVDYIDLLKLRASYGVNGNNNIDNYQQYAKYTTALYNGVAGYLLNSPNNDYLSWEKNKSWNIGIDYNFLKHFSGSIDFYSRKTTDMLLDRPLSRTSGFTSQMQNVGSLRNTGVEFQFDANIIETKDIQWNAGINISHNKSKILDLAGDEMISDADYGALKYIKGEKLFTFYLRDYQGVDPETGNALWMDKNGEVTTRISQARYINAGSPEPTVTGGFHTDVTWKGITLNIQLEGKFGNKVLIAENSYLHSDGQQMSMNQAASAMNYWKQPGDTNCNPKPVAWNSTSSNSSASTRFLENGSYVRIKDVTLAYTLPKQWLSTIGVNNLKVYASGMNVYTFHDVDYFDPERGVKGMGYGIYPMTKSFVFGLDVTF